MEKLQGYNLLTLLKTFKLLKKSKIKQIQKDQAKQLNKAKELFKLDDTHRGNTFYDTQTQKTYLIDLDSWGNNSMPNDF